MKLVTKSNFTSLSLNVFQIFNHICVKIANDSSKPNHLELLDYRDEYHGLVDCLNGKPSNYQNIYESLIKRGFKITHWQPTTKEDFWNEKHPYIMITWM